MPEVKSVQHIDKYTDLIAVKMIGMGVFFMKMKTKERGLPLPPALQYLILMI